MARDEKYLPQSCLRSRAGGNGRGVEDAAAVVRNLPNAPFRTRKG
jgi:hypothetical protein